MLAYLETTLRVYLMLSNSNKSEIRDSIIQELLEKVRNKNYGKYLWSVTLKKVRSFNGGYQDRVQFYFPVTALIGPNGGGKSTVLGAAACAYKSVKPGMFFPKSSIGDNSMADWNIEYELVDKSINPRSEVRKSSKFRKLKWAREEVADRDVKYFGINRTVPAGEKSNFKKLTKASFQRERDIPINQIVDTVARQVEHILGKSVQAFKVADIGEYQKFYIGGNGELEYSEFHFGAGEASIIRIVSEIELSSDNSLVLIEEIENGLHPVAVRRLVEYLLDVAKRKSIQAIFTTHSEAALEPLPSDAIWASIDGKVEKGKLSVEALRAISGRVDRKLAIFVEDEFAKNWLEAIIREKLSNRIDEVSVYELNGDGNATKTHINHNSNPSISFRSMCFIDGDSKQADSAQLEKLEKEKNPENPEKHQTGIYRLPGEMPESTVFRTVVNNLDNNIAILTVSCQRPPEQQENTKKAIKEVLCTNRDPHLLFNQVGIKIGFVPEVIVRGAFLSMWIRENLDEVDRIIKPIIEILNLPPKN
jgi:hypothetical protein